MMTPADLVDPSDKAVKGEITLQGSNGKDLKEFGANTEGTETTCYVLTFSGRYYYDTLQA